MLAQKGVEAIVPARPPPPEEFPALSEAMTRSAAVTNSVNPDYVRIVPMLLFDLPYEVTVLKGIIRSFDRQLHVTPAVQASLIERFRVRSVDDRAKPPKRSCAVDHGSPCAYQRLTPHPPSHPFA